MPDNNIKTILVLSGGGPKGAWQIGFLYSLAKRGVITTVDRIYGVSVGALNGFLLWLLLSFDDVNLKDAIKQVIDKYWLVYGDSKHIFKKRSVFKYIREIVFGSEWNGIYDTSPLRKNLSKTYKKYKYKARKRNIEFYAGVVDLNSGVYENIDIVNLYNNNKHKQIIDIVVASCSVPVVTPPVKTNIYGTDKVYVDGGVRNVIPNVDVDKGDDIFILATRPSIKEYMNTKYTLQNTINRFIEIVEDEFFDDDDRLVSYQLNNNNVHIFRPSKRLDVKLTKFTLSDIERLILMGMEDGMNWNITQ